MRILGILTLLLLPPTAHADEKKEPKKEESSLELKIVLKKDTIVWDADEKTRKEFKTALEEAEKKLKQKPPENVKFPPLPAFAATVQIKNISEKDVTIQVDADANILTFDLKGPGVVSVIPRRSFTTDFRVGRAVTLKPGERFEIGIDKLSDGFRRMTRDIYWTDLGEYILTASYKFVSANGAKEVLIKSKPVEFKVEEKK